MSEPMTSGEIEDVLSSIRKLVSDDLRPQPRPLVPPVAPPAQTTDKLILTPALRVIEAAAPDPAPAADASRGLRLDAVVTSVAAQVSPPAEGWEAETGDAMVTELLRPLAGTIPPEPFPDVAAEDDTPTPEEAGPKPLHFAWQSRRAGLDGLSSDTESAEPAADAAGPGEELVSLPDGDAGLPAIDAEALADLVRDVLRVELQGALGERMTRNIRKLVRAEVARMLAAKDLA